VQASPIEALGPPPFRFTPSRGPVMRGAAYSLPFKLIATLIVGGCTGWLLHLWRTGQLPTTSSLASWFLAGLAMMLYTWWCIVRSVTTIDSQQLQQTWVWHKQMDLRELAYARLIRVRGLEWLIAPRIYVRTLMGKFAVFYAADPAMVGEFERLVAELTAFRSMR
jgi:hypothetical protein